MSETINKRRRAKACSVCGNDKGFIKKYDINMCRKCFKANAERIGFEKLD
ncbi:MAG: 30S ribosomal protein S14 [archaeon]